MRPTHPSSPCLPVPTRRGGRCIAGSAWLLLVLAPVVAMAQDKAAPPPGCARLAQVAQALHLAGPGTAGRYQCDLQQRTPAGQVLALRYQGPEVRDGSSNLVGYYEVDRRTQAVHPWDLATGKRAAEPLPADAMPPPTVMACGLAFELPVHYRVTKPRRTEGVDGMRLCAFDVVPAKMPPRELECKDKDEGGLPPYKVCDWAIDGAKAWPTVQVARTRIDIDHKQVDPFQFENGAWRLPNAQADAEAAERFRFFGKRAYRGETVTRMSWYRTRIKSSESIYAGTGTTQAVLMQLTPQLAVVLVDPPADDSAGGVKECRIFCQSLRAAGRPGDKS